MAQKGILVKRNQQGVVVSTASSSAHSPLGTRPPQNKENATTQPHSDIKFELSVDDESDDFLASSSPTGSSTNLVVPSVGGCNGVASESKQKASGPSSLPAARVGRVTFSAPSPDTSPRVSPTRQEPNRLRVEFIGMEDVEKNKQEVENDLKRVHKREIGRLHQPRMSLLGKPLNYRAHKRDARYRRTQAKVYNFLERPKDWRAISYHLLV